MARIGEDWRIQRAGEDSRQGEEETFGELPLGFFTPPALLLLL
jgi:hypothetical protein